MAVARVVQLVSYPIKGCAGVSVLRGSVRSAGLAHDRTFMVVNVEGRFRSQRILPLMAVISPRVLDGGAGLAVSAPGAEDLELRVDLDGQRRPVSVHNWQGTGADQGDVAARWFSEVLGEPCRLVRVTPEHERSAVGDHVGETGFADAHAVLVTSLSSLDSLNARILERGAESVPMNRFRPNVVLAGWPDPHTEDHVRRMTIGGVEFGYAVRCVRCTVPTVDQSTGRKAGPEPIRTLAGYRREAEGGVSFGMKAAVLRPGEIMVGDQVDVHAWAEGLSDLPTELGGSAVPHATS